MALKEHISSPLEAGISVLDAHHLPPHVVPALEHAAGRLARRALHLTLVVVRRDYQLPAAALSYGSPGLTSPVTPLTPPSARGGSVSSRFALTSISAGFKGLVRSRSRADLADAAQHHGHGHKHSASAMSSPGLDAFHWPLRARWPLSPTTPLLTSPPPMTPCTLTSSATTTSDGLEAQRFELCLMHAPDLSPRAQKELHSALSKANKRFPTSRGPCLSPALSPAAHGLPSSLFNASLLQNEVLFSAEGLTLVALDHLYSVKAALASYSNTHSPLRLEDAVDELRRFVLAGHGAKIAKADLLRSYDWLRVSGAALADLDAMYRRAYGGPEGVGAIAGMKRPQPLLPPLPVPREAKVSFTEPAVWSQGEDGFSDFERGPPGLEMELDEDMIGIALTTAEPAKKPPPPRGPLLRLQTSFETKPVPSTNVVRDCEDCDGDVTARPTKEDRDFAFNFCGNTSSIDQMLLSAGGMSSSITPTTRHPGPATPNGCDEISPVTRSEWGFLILDDAFRSGRTVAVETSRDLLFDGV
ncbi:DEAD helicases superfamily protein (Aquarius) [Purpureocillium lavendulum]|uniref:DEAD helicases superfamily protein (Aquarius) n=1 Tax=Purpureocillium lavendulum TaxID=1247861 RepID=A0AB34G123_9HYPO|nr:DEAD helicases superfamily protein (Aquarius) [Purpureocillium lavendulum]